MSIKRFAGGVHGVWQRFPDPTGFDFALAGSTFRIRSEEASLHRQLGEALKHRMVPHVAVPDLAIYTWHTHSSPLSQTPSDWRALERWMHGEPVHALFDDVSTFIDPIGRNIAVLDFDKGQAAVWFADPSPPIWTLAAPFLRLLDMWFTKRGKILCHGAAIAKHGCAALLIGPGGAGKSTLALHAPDADFGYLGDDYVLVEPGAGSPIVYSVYALGKLLQVDADTHIPARTAVAQFSDERSDKVLLRIDEATICLSAPLVAVVEPFIGESDTPRLERISVGDALRKILPTSLRQLPGDEQKKLSLMARVIAVPCFRLHMTRDHARNLAVIDRHLAAEAKRLGLVPCTMRT